MASDVGIANSCFAKVGVGRINAFDDGTPAANFAQDRFAELRDDLLRQHNWNFARKRVQLAQVSTDPVSEYDRAYQLPANWIRSVRVHDNDAGQGAVDYREEDGKILASREQLWLTYIYQVTDANSMTPDFREALAYSMAIEAAMTLVESRLLSERMEARFQAKAAQAMGIASQTDGPHKLPRGSWVTRRFRGNSNIATTTSED